MAPLSTTDLLNQLHWRYAVKKFDKSRSIAEATWETLESSLVLTPSSFGLQPWKFLVINDPAVRTKLLPASWGQSPIVEASRLVVFTKKNAISVDDIDAYIARIIQVRGVSAESLAGYREMMVGSITSPGFDMGGWTARQVYIALGNFLTSCAVLGVDACPMEGIEKDKYDEILGLKKSGYTTLCVATAGYRSLEDKYAAAPKVRFDKQLVIQHV